LYAIQQQQQQNVPIKLVQTFPNEHSSHCISSLIHLKRNTLISSSSSTGSANAIVIWTKSKSSSIYKPIQRISQKETRNGISKLVLLSQKKDEEEFASCSYADKSIVIWRRKGEDEFRIKQKIKNVGNVESSLYISLTNELIFESYYSLNLIQMLYSSPYLLQIWSPSSSDFEERQRIDITSPICSLCQINRNNDTKSRRIEFSSGHRNGEIMIWSKQQIASKYSLTKTLQPFNNIARDLIFINEGFNFLITCCFTENKIVVYKNKEEEVEEVEEAREEELEHREVTRLISLSNGIFASGGQNKWLNIWAPC
jgi:hypothetical protein